MVTLFWSSIFRHSFCTTSASWENTLERVKELPMLNKVYLYLYDETNGHQWLCKRKDKLKLCRRMLLSTGHLTWLISRQRQRNMQKWKTLDQSVQNFFFSLLNIQNLWRFFFLGRLRCRAWWSSLSLLSYVVPQIRIEVYILHHYSPHLRGIVVYYYYYHYYYYYYLFYLLSFFKAIFLHLVWGG